jgi:hypothetical protein
MKRTGSCSPPALTLAAGMALTAALVCGRVQAADAATAERFEGLAYERGTKHLIYKEVHLRYSEGAVARHLVLYQCPGGEVFARKELRETYGPMQPDFDFEDGRDGYREGVHSVNGSRQVYFQENRSAPLRAQPLPSTMPAVIDAGFDAYVRANWKALSAGAALTVPFLVPDRLEFLDFRVSGAREGVAGSEPARWLRVGLGNWFGFLLPGIQLAYDREGTRLLQFEGLGTIRDTAGHNQDVRIVFPRGALTRTAAEEVTQARTLPLASTCAADQHKTAAR